MKIKKFDIEGPYLFDFMRQDDERGYFHKLFSLEKITNFEVRQVNFVKNNLSGTIRGMHYQEDPHGESKILHCCSGAIFDVIVDLRKNSPTYLKTVEIELSFNNSMSLFIPRGFAHGYQTLTDDVELIYLHDNDYNKIAEKGLNPFDPKLKIQWPLEVKNISERDRLFAYI